MGEKKIIFLKRLPTGYKSNFRYKISGKAPYVFRISEMKRRYKEFQKKKNMDFTEVLKENWRPTFPPQVR